MIQTEAPIDNILLAFCYKSIWYTRILWILKKVYYLLSCNEIGGNGVRIGS